MNNKGQSLVLFVLLLPIVLGVIMMVYDVGMVIHQKIKQESILEMTLQYSLEENFEKKQIEEWLHNNLENAKIEIQIENKNIYIEVEEEVNSIFSKLFGFSKFEVKSKYQGYLEQEKKKIKKIT